LGGPADVRIDFPTYCAHLLAAYDAIAASEEGAS
jgi:hypothetical protein